MNKSLNVLKCLAAFCVVNMHCIYYITDKTGVAVIDAITRFAVPLFFMISGYYSYFSDQNIDKNKKFKKRIINIIKLLILSWVIYIIIHYRVYYDGMKFSKYICNLYDWNNIFKLIVLNMSPVASHLWFLYALLYCYILMMILTKYNIQINNLYKYIPILLILNVLILGEIPMIANKPIESIYSRNFIFYGLPFFIMGYMINEKKLYSKITNKELLIISILSIVLIAIERLGTGKRDMYIGTIPLSISILIGCIKKPDISKLRIMEFIGCNVSNYIYILHIAVLWIIEKIERNKGLVISEICFKNTIVVFTITTIISIVIYYTTKIIKNIIINRNHERKIYEGR